MLAYQTTCHLNFSHYFGPNFKEIFYYILYRLFQTTFFAERKHNYFIFQKESIINGNTKATGNIVSLFKERNMEMVLKAMARGWVGRWVGEMNTFSGYVRL